LADGRIPTATEIASAITPTTNIANTLMASTNG
jgi:hypothetical protein